MHLESKGRIEGDQVVSGERRYTLNDVCITSYTIQPLFSS